MMREVGRASWRERVEISVVAVSLKKGREKGTGGGEGVGGGGLSISCYRVWMKRQCHNGDEQIRIGEPTGDRGKFKLAIGGEFNACGRECKTLDSVGQWNKEGIGGTVRTKRADVRQ